MRFIGLLYILFFVHASAQQSPSEMESWARQYLYKNKPDSALYAFGELRQKYPDFDKEYISNELGDIYLYYKKDTAKAAVNYLDALKGKGNYVCRKSCLSLASVNIGKKKYKEALSFLDLAEKEYPHFKICNAGEWERKTRLAYQYALCYGGMGNAKKAVSCLTQYMFCPASEFGYSEYDSTEYMKIAGFYLNELKKAYKTEQLKKEWDNALGKLVYKSWDEGSADDIWKKVDCHFEFFGEKVTLMNGGYKVESATPGFAASYSKGGILDWFSESPTYKALNAR